MDENEVRIIVREMILEILEAVKYPISEHALLKLPEVMGYMIKQNMARVAFIEKFLKDNPEFLLQKELVLRTAQEFQAKYPLRDIDDLLIEFKDEINKRVAILKNLDMISKENPSAEFVGGL